MAIDTSAYTGPWAQIFGNINAAQASGATGQSFINQVQDKNDATLGTDLRKSTNTLFPWADMMTFDDRAYANGWKVPFQSNFKAPVAGQAGPGGAIAGGGQGATNGNPFDINAPGAGLWSAGYDVNNAANVSNLYWKLAMDKDVAKSKELGKFYNLAPGTQLSQNDLQDFLNAADWYYRDQARQVDKQNKFGDSLIGKIVLGGLTAASGGAFGPLGGAAFGSALGATTSDPGMGALMGGLGGFGAGLVANAGGVTNLIKDPTSGFTNIFGGGGGAGTTVGDLAQGAVKDGITSSITGGGGPNYTAAAANAVPGAATGVGPASLAASLGGAAAAGTAALPAGLSGAAGGLTTAAGAGLGATLAQAAGTAGVSGATGGAAGAATGGATTAAGGAAPIINGAASTAAGAPFVTTPTGVGGALAGAGLTTAAGGGLAAGGSVLQSILGSLGGASGLGSGALSLLQGVLGQMNSGDLEKLAGKLNQQNQSLVGYIPPISYRDSILNNLNMIMNHPGQLMEQAPYKDYMDYAQRSVERKMVSQGYGGVGQSTNTADAVTRAVMESMSGIVQKDREIATNQLLPFFNVGINANTNMNNGTAIELQQAANAQNAGNWQNIISGGASILSSLFG